MNIMWKHSIRLKMTAILVSIISLVLILTWILNVSFAEKYYIESEKSSIIRSYEQVKSSLKEMDSMDTLAEDLEQISDSSNARLMIIQSDGLAYNDQTVVFSNMHGGTRAYERILDYLQLVRYRLTMEEESGNEGGDLSSGWIDSDLKKEISTLVTKGYYVTRLKDEKTGQNGIYLFGFTDDDYLVAMHIPIEGIRTSIRISSHFMAYISLAAIALGICAISFYAYRFTRPIKEMADVANRMSDLDFEARVNVQTEDEIGELGQSINKLSEALESTIADLKSANLELQQDIRKKEEVDAMRKEFVSHVSHELKTPIAIIMGYTEGLKDGIADDKESMDYYCDVIHDEAGKMNSMVRKLLTLNQLEFGTTPLNISRFDLCQMISNKLNSSRILFDKQGTQVEFDEKGQAYVWADEFMIEEVFTNYMTNALNHVREGGKIKVWLDRLEGKVRTNVYNEGDPIPEEELDKLWIKFYKADKARTREYGGNGIGLSIVAAAMKAHGKDYGVRNTADGVVFWFDLDTESMDNERSS